MKTRIEAIFVVSLILFSISFAPRASAQSEGVSKSLGSFTTRVDACADAKLRASDVAKSLRSVAATFLNQMPSYSTGECDCSAEKSPNPVVSNTWVCIVTVRMSRDGSGVMPKAPPDAVSETRVDEALGGSNVEACVKAKEIASAYVRGIAGGVLTAFGACQCYNDNSQAHLNIRCSVDTRYLRPPDGTRSVRF